MKKTRIGIAIVFALLVSAFLFTAALAGGPWTGDPDPYDCNTFGDCEDMVKVCISNHTYAVGVYYDPATQTNEFMVADAYGWSGIELVMGQCGTVYTGRWVHTYLGETWACNLVSEVGVDKNTPRFSNLKYVMDTCGDHYLFGPFLPYSEAEYLLCRETISDGILSCGNHYDTSY